MVGIYKITNKVNGKVYIGQSINITERWKAHRLRPFNPNASQYNSPLYRAIRKYGLSNFSFEVIAECSPCQLNHNEQMYISMYNSCNSQYGYNLTTGGEQLIVVSSKLTEEMVTAIYDLLMYSDLSQEKIAQQFGVSQRTISGINLGEYKIRKGYKYPLESYRQPKKIQYFCPICGKEVSKYGNSCIRCASIAKRVVGRPLRETLKEEIRNTSFVSLGKKYGVSDTAIRKWCKYYELPYQKKIIRQISDKDWAKI